MASPKSPLLTDADRKRRKRELILIPIVLVAFSLLTYLEVQLLQDRIVLPISNTILLFIIINLNLLLLISLFFLVFRNIIKLLYARRRKVLGSKLRTRLIFSFVGLTLFPTVILFLFSITFITNSFTFWFDIPVENTLENSLRVGETLFLQTDARNRIYADQLSIRLDESNALTEPSVAHVQEITDTLREELLLDTLEVYDANFQRIATSTKETFSIDFLPEISEQTFLEELRQRRSWSMEMDSPEGTVLRAVSAIPFDVNHSQILGYVAISTVISPAFSENMLATARGFEEYKQLKQLKEPIRATYYIILSIVGILALFIAIWLGIYMAKSISIPIMELSKGTQKVAQGDLDVHINATASDEIGSLVDSFNKMTKDLKDTRDQVSLAHKQLQEQNSEIEEQRQHMEIVLKTISAGVVTLDATGRVSTLNPAAEKMLIMTAKDVIQKSYDEILTGDVKEKVASIIDKISRQEEDQIETSFYVSKEIQTRTVWASFNALKDEQGNYIGVVIVLDDLTELEKAQRMAAWREVARRIAHEVKNPLTPIALSAQRLKRKYSHRINEEVFEEATGIIIEQVELIRNLVNEFSQFARFPSANLKSGDWGSIVTETVELYQDSYPNFAFNVSIPKDLPKILVDRQQMKQALINLIDNAIAATKANGTIWVRLEYVEQKQTLRLTIADDGVGIRPHNKSRLFEPEFSTKKTGMGLGLTIVSTIIKDHKGTILLEDNEPCGAKFMIELPVPTM